jgi:subtilisin family serine protease
LIRAWRSLIPTSFGVFFVNAAESNGLSGFDDDGNGYIDDYIGYDFFSPGVLAADENGHGTLVASIIAGKVNNGIGGAGISPSARIMALRVFDQFGRSGTPKYARVSDVAFALDYVGRNGARIVNLSLGGPTFSATEFAILALLSDAGVLIIAAAGNGGSDGVGDNNDISPFYPASYSAANRISVAAQDRTGGLANFSNYGANKVHLAAPGSDIYGADITRQYVFAENFESELPVGGSERALGICRRTRGSSNRYLEIISSQTIY